MRHPFMILLLLGGTLLADATLKHMTLRGTDFTSITEDYDVYDSKGRVLKFYRDEQNYDLKHLFNLTLNDKTGTCSARSVEEGSMEINGNTITLFTFWDRQGRIYDVPYGARIKRYEVQKDGSLKLLSSKLYIETAKKSFDRESGMRFLWETPKTDEDKAAFNAYIKDAERQYKGQFVFGKDAKALIKEVKAALDRKMAKRWR